MLQRKRLLYIGSKLAAHGKSPTAIDSLSVKLQEEGYSVISASSQKNKIHRMMDMALITIKKRDKVDLVLIDTYSTQNFYYAVLIGRICRWIKLPYIPILHGGNLPERFKSNPRLSKTLFKNAETNVAPSRYMKEQFKELGIQNLTYIPNSLEIENYPFYHRKSVKPKLLWVRSFAEIYNPLLALEIVEMLQKKGIAVTLCMVGPDKDGSLVRCKKVASDLKLPVTFTGILSKKEWIAISADYDIFINTTNFDNMPVSVMEAMALGLPVISTNVGGLTFLIDHDKDGILVPPNNAEAFVEAIIELCEQTAKVQEITKNARAKVEAFAWELVKERWIEVLGG